MRFSQRFAHTSERLHGLQHWLKALMSAPVFNLVRTCSKTQMILSFIAACSLIPIFGVGERILACTCHAEEPPCVAFQKADAVFVGSVIEISEARSVDTDTNKELLVSFRSFEQIKGVSASNLTVVTVTGSDCDFEFQVGKDYFVYAYRDPGTDRLKTGLCTRTKRLADAEEDVTYVRGLTSSGHPTSILARDGNAPRSLLEGASVIIEGRGDRHETVADDHGGFRFDLPASGKYRITIIGILGRKFLSRHSSWRVFAVNGRPAVQFDLTIPEGKCEFIDFSLWLTIKE